MTVQNSCEQHGAYHQFLAHKLVQDLMETWDDEAITENRVYKMIELAIVQNDTIILKAIAESMVPTLSWCW